MYKKLKNLILQMENDWFTESFLNWLNNHDDENITCMTDVIDTLTNELEDEISRCAEYN